MIYDVNNRDLIVCIFKICLTLDAIYVWLVASILKVACGSLRKAKKWPEEFLWVAHAISCVVHYLRKYITKLCYTYL